MNNFSKAFIKHIQCFIIWLLIAFIPTLSFSQSDPLKISVMRPAPEVSSLGKYGETPVSLYNGVPTISVPLHTISVRDASHSISASFHSVGQRVKEESTWLGLGWNLGCGGSISRSIRGVDDFLSLAYYSNNLLPDDPYDNNQNLLFFVQKNNISNLYMKKNGVDKNYYDYMGTGYDWESDIYYVNCGNLNAKFLIDKNKNFQVVDHSDIKIKWITDPGKNLGDWVVTTPDGTKYFFGDRSNLYGPYSQFSGMAVGNKNEDRFQTADYNCSRQTTVTSWFIRKIVSPQGEEIIFQYQKPKAKVNATTQLICPIPDVSQIKIDGEGVNYCNSNLPTYGIVNINYNVHEANYLKRINFKNGHVDFIRDTLNPRKDLSGAERLASIKVYEYNSGGDEELLKEFEFNNQEYFTATDASNGFEEFYPTIASKPGFSDFYIKNLDEALTKRLRLDGIVEKKGTSRKIYRFEYNNVSLPKKSSYAVDHFGFYNGKTSNAELSPGLTWNAPTIVFQKTDGTAEIRVLQDKVIAGANKTTDTAFAKALNIKKVVYPLGGWTEYEFEGNKYADPEDSNKVKLGGGFRIKKMIDYDPILNKSIVKTFKYQNGLLTTPLRYFQLKYCLNINYVTDASFKFRLRYLAELPVIPPFEAANKWALVTNALPNLWRYGSPIYPLSNSAGGNAVGYSNVEVWLGASGEFGKTAYTFHNKPDITPSLDDHGFVYLYNIPPGIPDFRNGNVLKQTEYAYENGAFRKIKETRNGYEITQRWLWNMSSTITESGPPYISQNYYIIRYPVSTGWSRLSYTNGVNYDVNGDSISTTQSMTYTLSPSIKYHLPSEQNFTKSDGTTRTTKYKYPADYKFTTDNNWIKKLDSLNILKPIEEREVNTEGKILGGKITKYHPSGQPLEVYLLENTEPIPNLPFDSVNVLPPNNLFKLRANYYYDNNSNLISQKIENYIASYVWGYQNLYPIAQATNAGANDIAYTGFEYESKGNWPVGSNTTDARTGKGAYSGSITKTSLNASKEYIISMWSKGGTPTISSGTLIVKNTINGWTYYEGSFTNATSITINSNGKPIDDLRLYLAGGQMISFTFDPPGPGTVTDENNVTSYYEYDDLLRLKAVRDQYGNILKAYKYNTVLK